MDKEIAKSLLSLAVSLDEKIVQMYAEVEKFSDEELKQRFRKAVGDLMGYVARDLIFPITNRYSDLDPDK